MGFQAVQQRYKKKAGILAPIAPYYGLSTLELATEAMILNLSNRGPTAGAITTTFTLNATPGNSEYMYFAYPASLGTAQFQDTSNGWYGGWDGANGDPWNVSGPALLNVHLQGQVVPFYVYRTDWPDLGSTTWAVSPEV